MTCIYAVTCIKPEPHRSRCWGYYFELVEADAAVMANATDMFENNYYTHAVIEEFKPGIIPRAVSEQWYVANYKQGEESPTIERIDRPEWAKQTCNWGLG